MHLLDPDRSGNEIVALSDAGAPSATNSGKKAK